MKLIKFIARSTSFSRREAEKLIKNSNIKVNGEVIHKFTEDIDPEKDDVVLNGKKISKNRKMYYKFYKPEGYVCSKDDKYSKTIYNYLDNKYIKYTYVGRLDKDATGLLILTNDGDMIYKLTHPSYEVSRKYIVKTKNQLSNKDIKKMIKGIKDNTDILKCDEITALKNKTYELKLHTGKKREIKRLIGSLGNEVLTIKRIQYGPIYLGDLNKGMIKKLTDDEIKKLKDI